MTTLTRDQFFGVRIAARQIGGFALSLTRYGDRPAIPWHAHDEAYLTFVISGSYRERLAGQARDCAPRALVLHAAGERHADDFASRSAVCLNLHFDPFWLRSLAARGDSFERSAIFFTPAISAIGARLGREFRRNDALSPIAVEGLLLELFAEASRAGAEGRVPAWLRKARTIVDQRFAGSLVLRELASEVDVHPVHLARAFRRHYGCTIGDLQRELRVELAKRRIRDGAALADVAAEAGFADQSHLTRTFRIATGVTPAEYRRSR